MASDDMVGWLLDSDPALRWQVERDLAHAPEDVWRATRARVATEGFGARLLALQNPDGQWAGGAFFPADFDFAGPDAAEGAGTPWTATTWVLNTLRKWGLDAAVLGDTADRLAANSRWEYENRPYWGGEVDWPGAAARNTYCGGTCTCDCRPGSRLRPGCRGSSIRSAGSTAC
jgi:hypothetical protein